MPKVPIVLIVDDDEEDREILKEILTSIANGIIVRESVGAEDALLKMNAETNHLPDIIFLDLNMPKIGGFKCLERIKDSVRLRNVPVYIYSTSAMQPEIEKCLKAGATGFLSKTSDLVDLKEKLIGILKETFQSN